MDADTQGLHRLFENPVGRRPLLQIVCDPLNLEADIEEREVYDGIQHFNHLLASGRCGDGYGCTACPPGHAPDLFWLHRIN